MGLDYNMIRDTDRPAFEKFLPDEFNYHYHIGDQIWECSNGDRHWKVIFKSADSDPLKFEGTKLDKAWFDEEPKNTKVFTSVERGLIDKSGDWIFTATPLLGTAWLKALSERKDVFSVSGTMWDNPYLPQAEVESYAASLTPEEKLVRIEGHYLVFGGRPVFDIIGLRQLLDELKDHEKHPPPSQGYLLDAA